ncbi:MULTISPECIES: substrate-binding domain-containing protein [Deinococcus]|uniref:Substrate-binding domain-containing protein n=1 Tax=Deinococcus rufus TaxID=2136097 RepID=A0ABV7Z205_9DEIO|nr:substrate-binding domain-containing protein [Deinococcus sp. AB2017081]WQE95148.1 substrate-binding domain-containing protein [Deinococcus sp. AB2017081]
MSSPDPAWHSHVRERREAVNRRAVDVARLTGITRQALHAIESGSTVPGTLTALRLAQVLGCTVEALFTLSETPTMLEAAPVGPVLPGGRVQLADVDGQLLAFALAGASLTETADGQVQGRAGGHVNVVPFGPAADALDVARRTAVVAGCDPSLGLLAAHVARLGGPGRVQMHDLSSIDALRAVARGEAHAAGIHLWDAGSGVSNLPFVEREWPGRPAQLYTLWSWEQGLIVARGNPHGITGPADLTRPELRLVNREAGAGSRLLLDAWLDGVGMTRRARRHLNGYADEATTPLDAAGRVAAGTADVAPGPRSAALALGLEFVPVQVERFDLVVPAEHAAHPGIVALLAAVARPGFRAELQALGGYDPTHAGEVWASLPSPPRSP